MDGRSRTRKSDLFDRSDADVRPTPGILYPDDEEGENEAHTNRLPAVDNGFNTLKTFVIFAIIVGCFAVVYPKFIHPVVLYAWGKSTQDKVTEEKFLPPRFQQGSVHPGAAPRVPRSNMHDRYERCTLTLRTPAYQNKRSACPCYPRLIDWLIWLSQPCFCFLLETHFTWEVEN